MRNQHRFLRRRGKCLVFIHGEDIGRRSCKRLMTSRRIRHLGMPTAHCKYPCISQALNDLKVVSVLAAGAAPFELIGRESLQSSLPCHLERPA